MFFESVSHLDLKEIRQLQPPDWPDIVTVFEFYIDSGFCRLIKTTIDDKIVGVGVSMCFGQTAWLAHIIVDSQQRKKGIGSQIVDELIRDLESREVVTCSLIATELGEPVYKKAGFEVVSEYVYLKRDKPWKEYQVSQNIKPFEESYLPAILQLDKKISGEEREVLLLERLLNSLVYIECNKVSGYFIPNLGEGIIYAETEEAGLELMKIKYAKADKAVLPSENITGIEFLKQNGFVESNTKGKRMVRGQELKWQPKMMYSRMGGNFG